MRPTEIAAYRLPYPRGDTAEYLAVDDHLVAQKVTFPELRSQKFLRETQRSSVTQSVRTLQFAWCSARRSGSAMKPRGCTWGQTLTA